MPLSDLLQRLPTGAQDQQPGSLAGLLSQTQGGALTANQGLMAQFAAQRGTPGQYRGEPNWQDPRWGQWAKNQQLGAGLDIASLLIPGGVGKMSGREMADAAFREWRALVKKGAPQAALDSAEQQWRRLFAADNAGQAGGATCESYIAQCSGG